jgi:hypothetical protein
MNIKKPLLVTFSTVSLLLISNSVYAAPLACPYKFQNDLSIGTKSEEVRLLQILLNSDSRTMVATSGPESPHNETTVYDDKTADAVKRFQEVFKEYIGAVNGNFGPRTRTVMNSICNGNQSNIQSGNSFNNVTSVQANATPKGEVTEIAKDTTPLSISISSSLSTVAPDSNNIKVIANFSKDVKSLTADAIIIDGGSVKEIRKLAKNSFAIYLIPDDHSKKMTVQIEADKVYDISGKLNDNASNEIAINADRAAVKTDEKTNTADTVALSDIINKILPNTAATDQNQNPYLTQQTQQQQLAQQQAQQQQQQQLAQQQYQQQLQQQQQQQYLNTVCSPQYQQQYQMQQQYQAYYGLTNFYQQNPCPYTNSLFGNSPLGSLMGSLLGNGSYNPYNPYGSSPISSLLNAISRGNSGNRNGSESQDVKDARYDAKEDAKQDAQIEHDAKQDAEQDAELQAQERSQLDSGVL